MIIPYYGLFYFVENSLKKIAKKSQTILARETK